MHKLLASKKRTFSALEEDPTFDHLNFDADLRALRDTYLHHNQFTFTLNLGLNESEGSLTIRETVNAVLEEFEKMYPELVINMHCYNKLIEDLEINPFPDDIYFYCLNRDQREISKANAYFYVYLAGIIQDASERDPSESEGQTTKSSQLCQLFIDRGHDFSQYRNAADFRFSPTLHHPEDADTLSRYPSPEWTMRHITIGEFHNEATGQHDTLTKKILDHLPSNIESLEIQADSWEAGLDFSRFKHLKTISINCRTLSQAQINSLPRDLQSLEITCDTLSSVDLSGLRQLTRLSIGSESEEEYLEFTDIQCLPTSITTLALGQLTLGDLEVLENLTNLAELEINDCTLEYRTYFPNEKLLKLEDVRCTNMTIDYESLLEGLPNLLRLRLERCQIDTRFVLSCLPATIQALSLSESTIATYDQDVSVGNGGEFVSDPAVLRGLTSLKSLDITETTGITQAILEGLPNKSLLTQFHQSDKDQALDLSQFEQLMQTSEV